MHPKYEEFCNIFEEERPQIEKKDYGQITFLNMKKFLKKNLGYLI